MRAGVAVILLAAGRSRRMGRCKQLLPLGESTVIARCLDTIAESGVAETVVVISPGGQAVADAIRDFPVRTVVNIEAEGDMASSVRAGRDELSAGASGVIVFPCDYPLVSAGTISALVGAHARAPDSILIPCHRKQRGHPLLFPCSILDELVHNLILRDLVRREPGRVRCLEVDDPGVLVDMDTPEDYHRIGSMLQSG